jgi:hypothetical protein
MNREEKLARLQKALDYAGPTHRISDVVKLLESHHAQLWEEGDGSIITEVHKFPLFSAVHYWLISGELKQCLALEPRINAWAIEHGCNIATACGRKGWGRVAAPTGWRPALPTFTKQLVGDNPL